MTYIPYNMEDETKPRIYIASPFFNPEQLERVEWLKSALTERGCQFYSPKDESNITSSTPTKAQREATFQGNVNAIDNSDFVVAITDGKDVGTIWEAGYAFAMDIPIIYFAETLGDNMFNLMLAESGIAVIKSREAFMQMPNMWDILANFVTTGERYSEYEGAIE